MEKETKDSREPYNIVYIVETYLIAKGGKKKGGQIILTFTEVPLK